MVCMVLACEYFQFFRNNSIKWVAYVASNTEEDTANVTKKHNFSVSSDGAYKTKKFGEPIFRQDLALFFIVPCTSAV